MLISEILKNNDGQALQIRLRKNSPKPYQYDCKELFNGKSRGWTILDGLTFNALKAVYIALSEDNKAKFDNIPLLKLVDFAWKHVKL